jgi:glyceraldehyde 3-phosphate dehydrogenase
MEMDEKVDIVAINDIASQEVLAHLFEFDSIHGRFPGTVEVKKNPDELIFNGDAFISYSERDPARIPWKEWDTDIVVECTGRFRTRSDLQKHREAGAKRVLLSAPARKPVDVDVTLVKGINTNLYDPTKHYIVSNASCTTNCLAPVVKVLDDNFGFEHGTMTTIHSYTNGQKLLDSLHKDYRRMRAAGLNMFPTTTGASKAIGLVLPNLKDKIDGLSVRIPISNVSLIDLTARLRETVTVEDLEEVYKKAAEGELKGILDYEWRSLVSTDFNHNPHSAIVDLPTLKVVDDKLCRVMAWYDNEWGYSCRTAELVHDLYNKENGI